MTTADPIARIRELVAERDAEAKTPAPNTPEEVSAALTELLAGEGAAGMIVATSLIWLGGQITKTADLRGSALDAVDHLAKRIENLERRPPLVLTERRLLATALAEAICSAVADSRAGEEAALKGLRVRLLELELLEEGGE